MLLTNKMSRYKRENTDFYMPNKFVSYKMQQIEYLNINKLAAKTDCINSDKPSYENFARQSPTTSSL